MTFKAILWDFGGVLTSSPFDSFARFEAEQGLPKDFLRGVNARNHETNAWALFESSQVSLEEFMACAVGGCAGCAVPVVTDAGIAMKRVCVDGPVFDANAVFPPAA